MLIKEKQTPFEIQLSRILDNFNFEDAAEIMKMPIYRDGDELKPWYMFIGGVYKIPTAEDIKQLFISELTYLHNTGCLEITIGPFIFTRFIGKYSAAFAPVSVW
jgi:hypothetical protein